MQIQMKYGYMQIQIKYGHICKYKCVITDTNRFAQKIEVLTEVKNEAQTCYKYKYKLIFEGIHRYKKISDYIFKYKTTNIRQCQGRFESSDFFLLHTCY